MILRVTGRSAGRRMPPGNDALTPASIARLEAWVRAGARLDAGLDPGAEIRSYAPTPEQLRRAELARLSTDDRDKLAEAAGRDRLKRAGASPDPEARTSAHFLLLAALPKERADRLLKALETGHGRLKALLGPAASTPLGGPVRIGVYVIHEPGAYAEFVRGVERRTFEAAEQSHADLADQAPYLVALDPLGGGEALRTQAKGKSKRADASGPMGLEGLLAEALGREAVARAGKAPRWLAEGVGGYLAAQVDPRAQPLERAPCEHLRPVPTARLAGQGGRRPPRRDRPRVDPGDRLQPGRVAGLHPEGPVPGLRPPPHPRWPGEIRAGRAGRLGGHARSVRPDLGYLGPVVVRPNPWGLR